MRYALILVGLVTMLATADGVFATGGSELYKINGYSNFTLTMFGMEGNNPANGFSFYNCTQWSPKVTDIFAGRLAFDTYYGYGSSTDCTLKLADAYLTFDVLPELTLMGGRYKLPFGYAYTRSGSSMSYLYRAAVASTPDFTNFGARDLGLCLTADFGPVNLDLSYSNGTAAKADTAWNKQFTARIQAMPAEWMGLGAAVAIIGQPEIEVADTSGTYTIDSWSATGIDVFAHADYPMSESATLNFEGEYMMLGFAGPDVDDFENKDAASYYGSLGATFGVDMGIITAIQPALRYESFTPSYQLAEGADEFENGLTYLDFGLNFHTGPMNTIQVGARNYGFENEDIEGYTDMYLNWRMLF